MKIFVCVKQVPDTETKIKLSSDENSIDTSNIKWIMNPYDEYAVEESLKYKLSLENAKVVVVSLGPAKRVTEALRTAMAMGADEGLLISTEEEVDSLTTAKAIAKVINQEGDYKAIFTGKLAIDDNSASVSQQIAEFLNIPHTTVVSKFSVNEEGQFTLEREIEGGSREVVQLQSPAVIGANKGLNQPRYASLPGIMKAKKKPIKEIELSQLGIDLKDKRTSYSHFLLPPEKPPVKMMDGDIGAQVAKLTQLLREEVKVI